MIGEIIKEFFLGSKTTRSLIGRHKIISRSLVIRYFLAEFFGTFILSFFLLGTTVIGLRHGDYVAAALGEGWAVMVGIYAVAQISGGHLNPAVSWAFFITGRMPSWLKYVAFSKLAYYPDGTFVGAKFSIFLTLRCYRKSRIYWSSSYCRDSYRDNTNKSDHSVWKRA